MLSRVRGLTKLIAERLRGAAPLQPQVFRLLAAIGTCWVALLYTQHIFAHFWAETIDDAAITYSYAENFGHGNGLRLTPGEAPVEGFSNFLQVLLLTPVAAVDGNLDVASKSLNLAFVLAAFGFLSWLVLWHGRGAWMFLAPTPFWLGFLWPTFNYWSFAGLEGGLLAGLQILAVCLLAWPSASPWQPWLLGITAGLLAWCRPEAVVYGGVVVVAAAFVFKPRLRAAQIFAVMVVALVAFRWLYFHDVVPNTYWAKIAPNSDPSRGMAYVRDFFTQRWWYFVSPLPVLALASRKLLPASIAAWVGVAWAFYFPIHSGGDWMQEFRFIQPALGLLIALCVLGILAIAEHLTVAPTATPFVRNATVALALMSSLILLSLIPPGWQQRAIDISKPRDLSYQRISGVAAPYRQLAADLGLKRRLLHADVDVGGTSFRSGLDIIDLAGLTDRTLALGWTRHPTTLNDYLLLERRPDSVHLHGGWLGATPFQNLPLTPYLYREFDGAQLYKMFLGPLTLLREDLVAAAMPPMQPQAFDSGGALGYGVSMVVLDAVRTALFVHVRAKDDLVFPRLAWSTAKGVVLPVTWDGGIALKPPPRGTWLIGKVEVRATDFPLTLSDASITVASTYEASRDCSELSYWARAPLYRFAGVEGPCACDPKSVLDPQPSAARVRGAAFLAELCERGWVGRVGSRWAAEADGFTEEASDRTERYEMASAAALLSETRTRSRADRVERLRALAGGAGDSLQTLSWVVLRLGNKEPASMVSATRLQYGARRFKYSLLWSWADGDDAIAADSPFCDSVKALGLRLTGKLASKCAKVRAGITMPVRANFEQGDHNVSFDNSARTKWISDGMRLGQTAFVGGSGGSLINTFKSGLKAQASLTWGPFRGPFSFFGLSGGAGGPAFIELEKRRLGETWLPFTKVAVPIGALALVPFVQGIQVTADEEIRARLSPPSETLLLDSLTLF